MKKSKRKKPQSKVKVKPNAKARPMPIVTEERPSLHNSLWLWTSAALLTMSVFSGLQTVIDLSGWAQWIVTNWQRLIEAFWTAVFGWFGVKVYPESALLLTFFVSIASLAFAGSHLEQTHEPWEPPKSFWKAFLQNNWPLRFAGGFAIAALALSAYRESIEWLAFGEHYDMWSSGRDRALLLMVGMAVLFLVLLCFTHAVEYAVHSLLLATFIAFFYVAISLPAAYKARAEGAESIELFRRTVLDVSVYYLLGMVAAFLTWARPKYLNMRFSLVVYSLVAILALNYVSLLGVSLRAPE